MAMWITEGSLSREQLQQMFGMDAIVTATNTSLALLLSVILVEEPRAAPILIVPLAIAFYGYRSYVAERQRHEKLEFLYEANRSLSQSREIAQALEGLLRRALEAYRAEQAEVIMFGAEGGTPLRTSLGPGAGARHDGPDRRGGCRGAELAARRRRRTGRARAAAARGRSPATSLRAGSAMRCSASCAARSAPWG